MKTFRFFLPAILLYCSCFEVKEVVFDQKIRYPDSEQKMDGDYYLVREVDKPTPDNPFETVELSQASKYKYRTEKKFNRTKTLNGSAFLLSGTAISILGGAIFVNHPEWFEENTNGAQAFVSGAGISALAWVLLSLPFLKDVHDVKIVPGYEYDYKPEGVLANSEILIGSNRMEKKFQTDNVGLMKFSPPFDFELNKLKTNDSLEFVFRMNNNNFINSLKLMPSEWMEQYARIKVSKTPLVSKLDDNLGYAREGMLYRVLSCDTSLINILVGSKNAWIDAKDVDVFYTTNKKADLTPAIKSYVVDEMQKWMQQGEFELPEDYLSRIAGKEQQLQVFTNEAMKTFQKEYGSMFDWNNSTISNYDPNSQTFKINIPALQEIVINVPIENAREFKSDWRSNVFKNQEFTMIDGQWELVSLQIEDPQQAYTVTYNSNLNYNYDPVNQFAFDFKDFEPDLSKLPINQKTNKVLETIETEKYTINTNLPKTNMQQPDAIAVVVGNALYQKTENVSYAINDAQLMKLYLTQVLGFKEGNIIFTLNAGKAELEGLFGTENNCKGKLFNYIKPDVSDVFVFYSGHGAPDPQTQEAYFVPTDCDPSYLNLQGYALKTLYGNLAKLPSKSTTVIIDACFSGAGVLKNVSSVRIKPKDTENNIPNSAILSSSSGDQVSSWFSEMKHGLFTYFFLKAIHDHESCDKDGDKQLTFKEIYNYISDKTSGIPYYARRLNAVEQVPVLKGNSTDRVFVKF